jgi:tRNA(adenine34) deaminase
VTDEAQDHGGALDIDPIDAAMMARCIELSRIGAALGELPIGSLIARRGQIIAESTNEIMRLTDESRHAEIIAIARARNLIGDDALSECTLYSTVEPCPMCAFCIRAAGLGRVAFALGSPSQ